MNVEAYIASGVLEAYAQGQLSVEERVDVERNLQLYPELRSELAAIEGTQEALLQRVAVEPKRTVRTSTLAALEARSSRTFQAPAKTTVSAGRWRLAAAASVVVALVASFLAADYRYRWKTAQHALADVVERNKQVAEDYNTVNERLERLELDLNIVDNPAFRKVVMRGTDQAPSALASVYWNETSKEVYLSVQELKDISAEQQFQLWAIIDGKPVDAGVFDLTKGRLLRMRNVNPGVKTFAVTIEAKGGKPAPTMETMQVAGNVAG